MTQPFEHAYVLKQLFLVGMVGVKTKGKFKECILYNKDILALPTISTLDRTVFIFTIILTTWSSLSKTTAIQPYKYSQCLHFPLSPSNLQTIFPP